MTQKWPKLGACLFGLVAGATGSTSLVLAEDVTLLRAREGAAAILRGQYEKAVAAYDEALSNPEIADFVKASIYSDRGVAKWRLKLTREAVDDFNQSIKLAPENATVYNNRGNALLDLGHPDEAVKDFDRAIELNPNYGAAFNNRGNARTLLANYQPAFQDFRKAVELMPTSAVAFNGRGKVHAAMQRYHAAVRDFTKALGLNARYEAAFANRGEANLHLEHYGEAADDFTQALSIKPDQPQLLLLRARAYAGDKKVNTALDDLNKAIELKPDLVDAYVERGILFTQVKRYDDAIADFSRAIELSPQNARAYAMRALARHQSAPPKRKQPAESVVAKPAPGPEGTTPQDPDAVAPDPNAQAAQADPNAPATSNAAAKTDAAPPAPADPNATVPADPNAPVDPNVLAAPLDPNAPVDPNAVLAPIDPNIAAAPPDPTAPADPNAAPAPADANVAAAEPPPEPVVDPNAEAEKAALADVEQALTLAPDDPAALRIRGDIRKATDATPDAAIADYQRALEKDPFQSESRDALQKLGQELPPEPGAPLDEPVKDWVIKEPQPGRYIATNPKYRNFRAELEMFGSGKPKILDWSLMKDALQGIGVLRYYAGDSGEGANQELVYTAIIDLWANKIVAIEPYSWGATPAQWNWQAVSVIVTDPDGNANEIKLRKPKSRPVAREEGGGGFFDSWGAPGPSQPPARRRGGGGGGGLFGWFR
jgi:tetratricopeptide (TPR) repeat protein